MFEKPNLRPYKVEKAGVRVSLDLSRYNDRFQKAQTWLDQTIADDMEPYIPIDTGAFRQRIRKQSAQFVGKGIVYAAVPPQGVYLWNGICRFCGAPLKYQNPLSTPAWFKTVKNIKHDSWVKGVENILKGKG